MNFPTNRWLPVVALILAWQVLLWQLPQAPDSNSFVVKKVADTVVAVAVQHVITLAESKPGDVKHDADNRWTLERLAASTKTVQSCTNDPLEYLLFGINRIWLLNCALLL